MPHYPYRPILYNMMGCRAALNISFLIFYTMQIFTEGACPPGWKRAAWFPSSCYKLSPTLKTYEEHEASCFNDGGHLASIHSQNEMNAIQSLVTSRNASCFIGLTDKSKEGEWTYSDSPPPRFFNWDQGEPNNEYDDEDCVEMKGSGKWNDVPCSKKIWGLCKRAAVCLRPELDGKNVAMFPDANEYNGGAEVRYICNAGYFSEESSEAECRNGHFDPSGVPTCRNKNCTLPDIQNTVLRTRLSVDVYESGSSVDYYCVEGFIIQGSSSAFCSYGIWMPSTPPQCKESVTHEEVVTGIPSSLVIGVLCILVVAAIIYIVTSILKKSSKCHRASPILSGPNEALPMHSKPHKSTTNSFEDFPRDKINLLEQIETGLFGPVYKATAVGLLERDAETTVQITFLEDNPTKDDKMNFCSMVKSYGLMKLHSNVLPFYGYSLETDPMFLISEYLTGGNLKDYLQKRVQDGNLYGKVTQRFPDSDLITFALQIVTGLEYISSKSCVHMDLKASKILLSHDLVCKISDFRPADSVGKSNMCISMEKNPSMKWMAPETVRSNMCSTKSNVWSFGVVMWEIMTSGSTPYQGMSNKEVLEFITAGCKLPRPCKYGTDMYATMMKCWTIKDSDRPEFGELRLEVEKAMEYCDVSIEYDTIDEDPEYGNATVLKRQ